MIESCSQTGHCRRMVSAQLAAQSVSSLCDGTESGIKRIVLYWSSASGIDPPRSEPESGAPPLLNRKPNWKRIQLLGYDPYRCDSKDWPVITDLTESGDRAKHIGGEWRTTTPRFLSFCWNLRRP